MSLKSTNPYFEDAAWNLLLWVTRQLTALHTSDTFSR